MTRALLKILLYTIRALTANYGFFGPQSGPKNGLSKNVALTYSGLFRATEGSDIPLEYFTDNEFFVLVDLRCVKAGALVPLSNRVVGGFVLAYIGVDTLSREPRANFLHKSRIYNNMPRALPEWIKFCVVYEVNALMILVPGKLLRWRLMLEAWNIFFEKDASLVFSYAESKERVLKHLFGPMTDEELYRGEFGDSGVREIVGYLGRLDIKNAFLSTIKKRILK